MSFILAFSFKPNNTHIYSINQNMQNIFVLLFTNIGVGTFNYIYLFNMDCFNPYIGLEFLFLTCLGLDILNLFNLFDLLDNLDFDLGYSDSESFDSESEYE